MKSCFLSAAVAANVYRRCRQGQLASWLPKAQRAFLWLMGFVLVLPGQLGLPAVIQSGVGLASLLFVQPAAAARAWYCENPPSDEGGGLHEEPDGDECYFPPNKKKSLGVCTSDINSSTSAGTFCGNPINLTIGNKVEVQTDYSGKGIFPLQIKRVYNSLAENISGPFGVKWSHNYSAKMLYLSQTKIEVVKWDQKVIAFNYSPERSEWYSDLDVVARLSPVINSSGAVTSWAYKNGDDGVDAFDVSGRLISSANRAGFKVILNYDASNRLVTVADQFGRSINLFYDSFDRVKTIKDPAGNNYRYEYDVRNNLASVQFPDNSKKAFLYQDLSNLSALTGVVDEAGVIFAKWTYDATGRAITSEHAGGVEKMSIEYDFVLGVTTVTDALGRVKTYGYATDEGIARTVFVNYPIGYGADSRFYNEFGNVWMSDKTRAVVQVTPGNDGYPDYIYAYNDRHLVTDREMLSINVSQS